MNKNNKKSEVKKITIKTKSVNKIVPVKKNKKKITKEIFADWSFSCDCNKCPKKCC